MGNKKQKESVLVHLPRVGNEQKAKLIKRATQEKAEWAEQRRQNEFFAQVVEDTIKGMLLQYANSPQADKMHKKYGIECTSNIALWTAAIMTKGIDKGDVDSLFKLLQILDTVKGQDRDKANNSKLVKILRDIRQVSVDAVDAVDDTENT